MSNEITYTVSGIIYIKDEYGQKESISNKKTEPTKSEFYSENDGISNGATSPRNNNVLNTQRPPLSTSGSPSNPISQVPSITGTEDCCCVTEDEKNCIDPKYIFDDDKCECVYNITLYGPLFIP